MERIVFLRDLQGKVNEETWWRYSQEKRPFQIKENQRVFSLMDGRGEATPFGDKIKISEAIKIAEEVKVRSALVEDIMRAYKLSGVAREFNEKGGVSKEAHIKGGKLNGVHRWWTDYGEIITEVMYKNDLRHGVARQWETPTNVYHWPFLIRRDGSHYLSSEVWYKNGEPTGRWKSYDRDGNLTLDTRDALGGPYGGFPERGRWSGRRNNKPPAKKINAAER